MFNGFKSEGFRKINLVGLAWIFVSFVALAMLLSSYEYDFFTIREMIVFLLAWVFLNIFWIVIKIAETGVDQKNVVLTPARSKVILKYKTIGQIASIFIYVVAFVSIFFPELFGRSGEVFAAAFFLNIVATAFLYYQIKELAKLCPVCGSDENDSEHIKGSSESLSFNSSRHREKLTCRKCKSSWEIIVTTTWY